VLYASWWYNTSVIQAIIFDCFGVLISDATQALLAEVRASDPKKAERLANIGATTDRGLQSIETYVTEAAALLAISENDFRRRIAAGEVRNQNVLDFAASLRPRFKTALLSNVSRGGLDRRFAPGELDQYFDVVLASGDIGFAKPDPGAYTTAAERLGLRPDQCLMIDDRPEFCAGARAVDMQAVQFISLDQLQKELDPLLG